MVTTSSGSSSRRVVLAEAPLCSGGLFPLLPPGDYERGAAMGPRGIRPSRSSTR